MNDHPMRQRLLHLLTHHRWAALATADSNTTPMASMVGYVMGQNASVIYLHLSQLAAHTGNLLANGKAALVISESDINTTTDPQELARVSLQGRCVVVTRNGGEYSTAKAHYLQRLPASERLFDFPDFVMFRLEVESARFVGGFAQARSFSREELGALS